MFDSRRHRQRRLTHGCGGLVERTESLAHGVLEARDLRLDSGLALCASLRRRLLLGSSR